MQQEAHRKVGLSERPSRSIRKLCRYSSLETFEDAFDAAVHLSFAVSHAISPTSVTSIQNVDGHPGLLLLLLPGNNNAFCTSDAVSASAPWMISVRLSMFSFSSLSDANLPPIIGSNKSATSGSFSFSGLNLSLEPQILLEFQLHRHHDQVMVTVDICSRKCSAPGSIDAVVELLSIPVSWSRAAHSCC